MLGVLVFSLLFCSIASASTESSKEKSKETIAKLNYQLFCQGCHTPKGEGGSDVPPLLNTVGFFLNTSEGRAFLIQVPGVAYTVLSDEKLADVMNWVIKEYAGSSEPLQWEPYNAEEIASYRKTPLKQVNAYRAQVLRGALLKNFENKFSRRLDAQNR